MKTKKSKPLRALTPQGVWITVPRGQHFRIIDSGEIIIRPDSDGVVLAILPKGSTVITNWK